MKTSPDRPLTPTARAVRLGLVASMLLAGAAHAEGTSAKFVLTAYTNGAGGTDLVAGDYQTALAALTKPKRKLAVRDPLTTSTNLCVAYTMTKQWEMARTACDEAITEAKHERLRSPAWTYSTRLKQNSYVALAYSNRAVLNWLSNNSAGAEQDLSSAAAYAPKADFVARNLAALRSAPSTLAQAVVAPQK